MKTLNQHIKESLQIYNESILDDEEDLIRSAHEEIVRDFISENYYIYGKITMNKVKDKYIVDCDSSVGVSNKKIETITDNLFEWGAIEGDFNCFDCTSLKSLNGAPKKVSGDFDCEDCKSLTSLEGSPKTVGGSFYCRYCNSLTSLKGAPEKVGEYFDCFNCKSLTSLKGSPKEVGWDFECGGCKTQFTKEDVEKISKVKGNIFV